MNENYVVIDFTVRTKECEENGHKWQLSGFYKYNPHLWCSHCGKYLDLNEVNELGLRKTFDDLLKNNNPEEYYL